MFDPAAGYFVRFVDLSPALTGNLAAGWRHLLGGLSSFLELVPGRVVNRPGAHTHNAAKPLHEAWLRSRGYRVPESVTSCDASVLCEFVELTGEVVVKALSGMRGIARLVRIEEFGPAFDPRSGPVHLQRYVRGYDVRVHVVGDEVFPIRIDSEEVDYRSANADAMYTPVELPRELLRRVTVDTAELGLVLAGWDFKVAADGTYWCLEVNPMPGYDMYDRKVNGAITRAVLRYWREPAHARDPDRSGGGGRTPAVV